MRTAEATVFAGGKDSFDLMSEAGAVVAAAILRAHPEPSGSALVLCGPGNNGGDGFIVAGLLHQAGWRVSVAAQRARADYVGDAGKAAAAWQSDLIALDPAVLAPVLAQQTLVVDALFGIGLDRPLQGKLAAVIDLINQAGPEIWAVDIPSGIQADTGHVLGTAICADFTITFGWLKPGHLLLPGRVYAGAVEVAALGFDAAALPLDVAAWVNAPGLWLPTLPEPGPLDHKYSRGHALVIGGSEMPGAGRLAALAARRIGAGMQIGRAHV